MNRDVTGGAMPGATSDTTHQETEMATIEKPQVFEAPGREGSLVEVAERYDNFIGGGWVAPAKGWVPGEPQPGYR
jgi:hypothetical protein